MPSLSERLSWDENQAGARPSAIVRGPRTGPSYGRLLYAIQDQFAGGAAPAPERPVAADPLLFSLGVLYSEGQRCPPGLRTGSGVVPQGS